MFERIVLAVDGSPQSSKTIPVALDLAQKYGSSVLVVHVREHTRYEGSDVDMGPPIPAESLVDQVVTSLREAGVDARGEIRRVSPGETPHQIVEAAASSSADLIVIGTRGMTELRSLVLGGVANKVVHLATCPVLLVR
jgi:nucleotide-binding universal stress UspA family protein